MKVSIKALTAIFLVATFISANPAFAATGGRISGGRFGGSSSSSRSSSRPSSSYIPRSSYSYTPAPRVVTPSPPSRRRDYDDDYYYNRRSGGSSVIIIPPITPVLPVAPAIPTAPEAQVAPTVKPTPVEQPNKAVDREKTGANPLLWILLLASAGLLAYFLLSRNSQQSKEDSMTLAHVQVALLASAKDIQEDLLRMANNGDTSSIDGLSDILKETTLALMRHPDRVVYVYGETFKGSPENVEHLFNKKSIEERSKVSEELVTNDSGKLRKSKSKTIVNHDGGNEHILVSLIVVADSDFDIISPKSWSEAKANLINLGAISPEELVALEIIWQPEDGDALSQEELLSLYPNLVKI
jgi:uncharacterized membrane protein